jgi:hypothetical protein
MLAFRSVQQSNYCAREEFLYILKAGPAGGRLRRPSSAGTRRRTRHRHTSSRSACSSRVQGGRWPVRTDANTHTAHARASCTNTCALVANATISQIVVREKQTVVERGGLAKVVGSLFWPNSQHLTIVDSSSRYLYG